VIVQRSRQVASPLTAEALADFEADLDAVWFNTPLSVDEHRILAAWLEQHPQVALWARGTYQDRVATNLEFLTHYPRLTRLRLEGFTDLAALTDLELGDTLVDLSLTDPRGASMRTYRIAPVTGFRQLRRLYVEGPLRDAERLGELTGLTSLTARSVTLTDLAPLTMLTSLRRVDIKLGGTRDLRLLPHVGRLEEVELWMIPGLSDVKVLAEIPTLSSFFLQSLRNVTQLPSFAESPALKRVVLQTMKGITDLRPLALAPNLEVLALTDMGHLGPDHLRPFLDHPKLRDGSWGFGSVRKNAEAWDLLPLGPKPFDYDAYKARQARRR
jgi:hypothetical protein